MGDPASAAITAGGDIIGGGMDMIGQGMANAREGRLSGTAAGNLNELIDSQILQSNTVGLENAAGRALQAGGGALNAQLAGRGIYNSGAAMGQHRALTGDVMSNLAQQINQDQLSRAGMAGEILQNPAFGFFDRAGGGGVTNQGK